MQDDELAVRGDLYPLTGELLGPSSRPRRASQADG